MHKHKKTIFQLSLISLAVSGYASANQANLDTVEVQAQPTVNHTRNISNLRELLANRTDVNIGGGSVSAQYISIRGAGQDRIGMVVDNTSTNTQQWYHQGRFQLDPSMVKSIKVDKGAGAASAGIGMTDGVIRAETVSAKDLLKNGNTFGARIGSEYNSNRGVNGSLSLYGQADNLDILLLGSWGNDKNYKAGRGYSDKVNTNSRVVNNTARRQGNYLAKFGYDLTEKHRIGASFRQETFYGNGQDRFEMIFNGRPVNANTTKRTYNLEYTGKDFGLVRDIQANAFYIDGRDQREDYQKDKLTGYQRHSKTETSGANLALTSELNNEHLLKYGVNLRKEQTSSQNSFGNIKGEQKSEYGLYAEGIWSLGKALTLTTGLRYDHYTLDTAGKVDKKGAPIAGKKSVSDSKLNPSFGLIWDVTPNFSLNAKLNYASRSPILASAYTVTDNRGSLDKARGLRFVDPNLKTEDARLAEVGFEWKYADFNVKGSVFEQRVKNFYQSKDSIISNAGTLNTKGYEAELDYQWNALKLTAGVAYADPKADFALSNDPLNVIPQGRQWSTGVSYKFAEPSLELGWLGRYAQSKEYQTGSGAKAETKRRIGYGVHDIFVNWQPLSQDNFNVNFTVKNIGNKFYRSHSQRNNAVTPPSPGREFKLGMNYSF
ncbi:TonB-dependent receptor domain-containing protein [Actinobacillus equuli]|uniref:TonB-dependent receptor domain-containing protein n=1 Tax=Actinobacillus equuli TaxID=718 RepID=UPI0024412406|nr:TonB-dependent receptor [Actinobacillus equuli]WGE83823.1 TonB-dependent receptor [Actinobacillus equuli subsp. equuli]WGE85876.1 TonB-dependent receptor [Actinobacillus equuli subsp. haemolyticus]